MTYQGKARNKVQGMTKRDLVEGIAFGVFMTVGGYVALWLLMSL